MPVYPGKGKPSNLGSSFLCCWPSPDTDGRKRHVALVLFQWQSHWRCEILTAILGLLEQLQKPVLFHPPCQPLTVLAVLLISLGVTKGNFCQRLPSGAGSGGNELDTAERKSLEKSENWQRLFIYLCCKGRQCSPALAHHSARARKEPLGSPCLCGPTLLTRLP